MSEIIEGGVPTGSSVLSKWSYNNVTVIANPTYEYVFSMLTNGYLNQFKYIAGTVSNVNINIQYKNSTDNVINGLFVIYNVSDNNSNIALMLEPTGDNFETLSLSITLSVENMKQVAFELTNTSGSTILIAGISIDVSISDGTSSSIDTSDFIQCSIMFGTDANKPALR